MGGTRYILAINWGGYHDRKVIKRQYLHYSGISERNHSKVLVQGEEGMMSRIGIASSVVGVNL